MSWFQKITIETNKYARQNFSNGKAFGEFSLCGYLIIEVTLTEIMVLHGGFKMMMLFPTPGRKYDYYWRNPQKYSFVRSMTLRRFQQLRSVVSFNSVERKIHGKSHDSLYKVGPLLNLLKKTLPFYLVPATEVSMDEATFASRSSFARFMIYTTPKTLPDNFILNCLHCVIHLVVLC